MNWDALYARLAICGNIKEHTISVVSNGEYKIHLKEIYLVCSPIWLGRAEISL